MLVAPPLTSPWSYAHTFKTFQASIA